MKKKTNANQNRTPKAETLTASEQQAIRHATEKGLYLLFEGTGRKRVWRIYGRVTGEVLATYWPDSGRLVGHAPHVRDFTEASHTEMFERLDLMRLRCGRATS